MDIYARLHHDHDAIRRLFDQLLSTPASAPRLRQELFARLRRDIEIHHRTEEQVFYRSMRHDPRMGCEVLECIEEHRFASGLLEELSHLSVNDQRWASRLEALKEGTERHMQDEETAVFAEARALFNARRAEELEDQYRETRSRLAAG